MKQKKSSGERAKDIIGAILLVSLVLSLVFVIINMVSAPGEAPQGEEHVKVRSDYTLSLVQCALAVVVMFIPSMLQKRFCIAIPNYMYVLYFVFLYCAVYLGEIRNFYFIFPQWDAMLHTFSGAMLGALGFSLVSILNDQKLIPMSLSPFFLALFALCFAVFCGVLWEIYEYTLDGILGLNMQKFALEDGTALAGRLALEDTMEDLIVDTLGALAVCIAGYLGLKAKRKKTQDKPLDLGE